MYSMGGWITIPGSWSSGFKSRPSGCGWHEPLEGVGRKQHEEQKSRADETHHAEDARHHLVGQAAAEYADRHRPRAQHEHPQEQRPFVRAPGRRDAVVQRQAGVGIRRDVEHREIAACERPRQATEGDRDEHELPLRGRPRQRHPLWHTARGADERQRALCQREGESQYQRELANLRDHRAPSAVLISTW
jgi:hypothetical protein